MANNAQIASSLTIVSSMLGFQAISLTAFTTSAQSLIAAGSKVEVGGAYFTWSADETPQATTWTALSTADTAYITLTPSGAAGAQILTAKYSSADPEWSDSKQGYYLTATSIIRYVGSVIKTGAATYEYANLLPNRHGEFIERTIDIGIWDMDGTATLNVTHYVPTYTNIKEISAFVTNDDGNTWYDFIGSSGGGARTHASIATLIRTVGGVFDDPAYDDGAINRGQVIVGYTL